MPCRTCTRPASANRLSGSRCWWTRWSTSTRMPRCRCMHRCARSPRSRLAGARPLRVEDRTAAVGDRLDGRRERAGLPAEAEIIDIADRTGLTEVPRVVGDRLRRPGCVVNRRAHVVRLIEVPCGDRRKITVDGVIFSAVVTETCPQGGTLSPHPVLTYATVPARAATTTSAALALGVSKSIPYLVACARVQRSARTSSRRRRGLGRRKRARRARRTWTRWRETDFGKCGRG